MNLENFKLSATLSIKDALAKIDLNCKGFVLVVDENEKVIGIATDGDIRRKLIENISLEDSIINCINTKYIRADADTPREMILKQLDHKIKAIPVLDKDKKLVSIFTPDHLPERSELRTFSRAKSPVRISFGGGGSDVSTYFSENGGAVINATISLYSHATLRIRDDKKIMINSLDLNASAEFADISDLFTHNEKFSLIRSLIKAINPSFGFELFLHSDFPMNSGLGGSAVVSAAVLGCFNELRNDKWDQYELAEMAFQAERLHMGVAGGWQDQYATVFGGLNFMEFNRNQNIIHPIRLPKEILLELEECLVLCYTGVNHDSGNIHEDQKEQTKNVDVKGRIQANVNLTYEMRNLLLRGSLHDFGISLHKAWELKKSFSSKISNSFLNNIYDDAIKNGAIGGKLLGAGGGGYFLFYVPAFEKHRLMHWIKESKLNYAPFRFEETGLKSWTVREKK